MDIVLHQNKNFASKKEQKEFESENLSIMKKINEIEDLIDTINNIFDYVTEPELVDGCIYELNALYKKYTYYIRLCKDRGIVSVKSCNVEKG